MHPISGNLKFFFRILLLEERKLQNRSPNRARKARGVRIRRNEANPRKTR